MTDERVRVFQRKLYIRAKQDKGFKAYSIKDKLCLDYVLVEAWRRVKQNYSKGTGVDKMRFSDIENYGLHKFLSELQTELRTNTYQCSAVRNVEIPKEKKGEYRILGIPTIKDRVVQMAVKMLIEPIWEADFIDTLMDFGPTEEPRMRLSKSRRTCMRGINLFMMLICRNTSTQFPMTNYSFYLTSALVIRVFWI